MTVVPCAYGLEYATEIGLQHQRERAIECNRSSYSKGSHECRACARERRYTRIWVGKELHALRIYATKHPEVRRGVARRDAQTTREPCSPTMGTHSTIRGLKVQRLARTKPRTNVYALREFEREINIAPPLLQLVRELFTGEAHA